MKESQQSKQIAMWNKVNELKSTGGLNVSQISRQLSIDRKTVRKLLRINLKDFLGVLQNNHRKKKLSCYEGFIKSKLEFCSDLSSACIGDKLKEEFGSSIQACSKTIYNYVQQLRQEHNLPKLISTPRQMEKWDDTPYGQLGQVDFGSKDMQTVGGSTIKVYFMSIVLNRSRAKFFHLQTIPFTSASAVYAHQLAFEYFEGVPTTLLYDQDRVFIKGENLGDFIHTSEFASYIAQEGFKTDFCRKADPQTKGKVENSVKFIKNNFLAGRIFKNIHMLNQQSLQWLERTGNGKIHETTKLIPLNELQIEREYLQSIKIRTTKATTMWVEYTVLKDNTLRYKGNIYSLPVGTYTKPGCKIRVFPDGDDLYIYDTQHKEIARHTISPLKGQYIKTTTHSRDRSVSLSNLKKEVIEILIDSEMASEYLSLIEQDKPRYFRDNLLQLKKRLPDLNAISINVALSYCLEHNIYNAYNFVKIADNHASEQKTIDDFKTPKSVSSTNQNQTIPAKSNINTYQNIM